MTKGKTVLLIFLAVSVAAALFLVIRFFALPNMEKGMVYQGHTYAFLSSNRYYTLLTQSEMQANKAVGRFDDAIIYTLKNDPDEFYLYPKVFLPHLPYNLLYRVDALPLPGDGEIDSIILYVPNEEPGSDGAASQERKLDKEAEDSIVKAFRNESPILTDHWEETEESETYLLVIRFQRPVGLCYSTKIVKYEDAFGVLLDDGKTLASVFDLSGYMDQD